MGQQEGWHPGPIKKAILLLRNLHLEVGGVRGAEGALRSLPALERPGLERTNGEDGASKADDARWLLERVLESEDAVLPLGKRGEERVEVLGEEEARDGEHGHAAVLKLGLTELVHLLLVGAGRVAERVGGDHGRGQGRRGGHQSEEEGDGVHGAENFVEICGGKAGGRAGQGVKRKAGRAVYADA